MPFKMAPELQQCTTSLDDGRTLSYLCAGPETGRLLIFVHGWPAIGKTWKPQLDAFASRGYRVVAPDMPGYGGSTSRRQTEDYSLENVNKAMAVLLADTRKESAIWIGHDYGAVAVWSFAAHYPKKTDAVICLARPYHTLELGLEEVLPTINREIYPEDQYPYGQYDYQVFFEQSFDKAYSWFEKDVEGVIRGIYARGNPAELEKPSITSTVTKAGGWFGGAPEPPAQLRQIPSSHICIDEAMYTDIVNAMKKSGFWGPCAWYSNHQRNRQYSLEQWKNDGYLHMPVLFIGANWDPISDISVSKIAEAQKKYCLELTERALDAGHWIALEKPKEVEEIMACWMKETLGHT